jgi:hypothetical protein
LNTVSGGPSIDSKAMLAPRSAARLALGVGVVAQPPAASASAHLGNAQILEANASQHLTHSLEY